MKQLKYYVLGNKNSPLLKEYSNKFYIKLLEEINYISNIGGGSEIIKELINIDNRSFILNPDISSIIYSIINNKNFGNIKILERESYLFISEGIDSERLVLNQGEKIAGTDIRLTLYDSNPYNKVIAHPDHKNTGGLIGYGNRSKNEWLDIYEKSFKLLKKIDINFYEEINFTISKIIPLGTSEYSHNSSSYKECVGHLYLGYTTKSPNPEINNVEAIIHEASHNKLNLILQFDKLILNDLSAVYYSSIRPDARPIYGVFIGYHAFAPTMYVVMKAYLNGDIINDEIWLDKIVLFYFKTKLLQKVIGKYAKLTNLGKKISKEIDFVILEMDILFKKISPSRECIFKAKKEQDIHFKTVNDKYRELLY